jgi:hypothetical protein
MEIGSLSIYQQWTDWERNQGNNPIHNGLKNNKVHWNKFNKYTKHLYNENYKPLKKVIKDDIRRWKDLPCSWIGRIDTVKCSYYKKQSTYST